MSYESVDLAYQDLLQRILDEGERKENRTGIDTLSVFGHSYEVDISDSFPLLTLKNMSGRVFDSMIAELLWFLSGEHHISNLKEHTSIWDEWADEGDNLDFAYGRFWRRYPIPERVKRLSGEEWDEGQYTKKEKRFAGVSRKRVVKVFDQIEYILDTLKNNPSSRRMVLNAWHPANCAVANPPACHCMAAFNVSADHETLNCHLTIRSNDVGLGHPFNVAQYSLLTHLLADQADMEPGSLYYSGTDVHLYVSENQPEYDQKEYAEEILSREPKDCHPSIEFPSRDSIDDYEISDFSLSDYKAHPHIGMKTVP